MCCVVELEVELEVVLLEVAELLGNALEDGIRVEDLSIEEELGTADELVILEDENEEDAVLDIAEDFEIGEE